MATLASIGNNTWGISTIGYGVIAEGISLIRQRISIVLRTSRGSDPMRPVFGSRIFEYISMPSDIAIPNIKAEIVNALQMWMPEINVLAITHTYKEAYNPLFAITYEVLDDSIVDKLLFDLKEGTTTGGGGVPVTEIILQAFFPPNPNNYRYQIQLIINNEDAHPIPDSGGFATIPQLFEWIQANWFFRGRWHLLSDRIVCYMNSEGITGASLAILVLSIVRLEKDFPLLEPDEFYSVQLTVNGSPAAPAMPATFITVGDVLVWAQTNWSHYGEWSVEGVPGNNNTTFSDEFSTELDAPEPDTFRLILTSDLQGFTGDLQISKL